MKIVDILASPEHEVLRGALEELSHKFPENHIHACMVANVASMCAYMTHDGLVKDMALNVLCELATKMWDAADSPTFIPVEHQHITDIGFYDYVDTDNKNQLAVFYKYRTGSTIRLIGVPQNLKSDILTMKITDEQLKKDYHWGIITQTSLPFDS